MEIHVPEAVLADLRERLARARLPEDPTTSGQGPSPSRLRAVLRHWRDAHDWRACEARVNRHEQVLLPIDGLEIHAVHLRSADPDAVPVVLTHGWPGSFLEYLDVAERLKDRCHVVLPSLPGYGFSGKPVRPGWGVGRTADAWAELMGRLGYDRFVAGGSDWGTSVSAGLGARHPDRIRSLVLVPPLAPPDPDTVPTRWEQDALDALQQRSTTGSAYGDLMRTRPQTIGTALTDSPAALAAWVLDKVDEWAAPPGVPVDTVLDTLTLYWVTASGASAARLYAESIDEVSALFTTGSVAPVEVPVTAVMFPAEVPRVSRRWAERRFPDIRGWIEPAHGGHFGGWEHPEVVAEAVRTAIRTTTG